MQPKPTTHEDPMLALALSYAARGWPCFPCRPADDFDPETGEVLPEKAPLISNGFRGATTNERVIRELWKRNPGALVGIPTGERTNVWVLDLDVKTNANGHEWLEAMEDAHGDLPHSARVQTANGGTHIFFRHVEGVRNRGKLGAGVDVRGEGGFVISGGSIMQDGRAYHWLDDTGPDDVVDAPDWLLRLVLPPVHENHAGDWQYQSGSNDRYVKRAVEAELSELACTPPGNRGYQLNASAFALGTIVGAGALPRSEAEHGLYAAAVTCGVAQADGERETWAKIRRGLDAGEKQPRHIPVPEAPSNDNTRLVDISRMIENGLRKAERAKQSASQDYTQERIKSEYTDERIAASEPAKNAPDGEHVSEKPTQTSDIEPAIDKPAIIATPFNWIDPKTLPRRSFAFGSHYIRKYVSVTGAPGGLGKTANSIVEALAMASGRSLTGIKPDKRLRVWLFNMEDPRDELERRIMAACLYYNLKPADIEQHLFLDTGREQELVIAREDKRSGVQVVEPIVEAVTAQIKANGIDVMIVDPFVSTHAVNENDNGAIDKVAKLWAHIADRTNCAIDVVHHLRKVSDREATVEDMRGAVALIGAARSVRILNRMTEEQATKAGVDDRLGYFSIAYGKANLTPLSSRLDWRRLESVPLGNGRGLMKPQDFAPVVTEWKWPSKEEIAESIPDDVRRAVVVRLANQNYRESPQSSDWAGYVVAEAMGVHLETGKEMTPEKRRIKSVIDSWIESGVLAVIEEPNPKHVGRTIKFVRPA